MVRKPQDPKQRILEATTEAELQNAVLHTLKGLGSQWYCHIPNRAYSGVVICPHCRQRYRTPNVIPAGIPDTLAVFPGLLVVAELKTVKGALSPEQQRLWATLGDAPQLYSDIVRPDTFNAWADKVAQAVIKGKINA